MLLDLTTFALKDLILFNLYSMKMEITPGSIVKYNKT